MSNSGSLVSGNSSLLSADSTNYDMAGMPSAAVTSPPQLPGDEFDFGPPPAAPAAVSFDDFGFDDEPPASGSPPSQ